MYNYIRTKSIQFDRSSGYDSIKHVYKNDEKILCYVYPLIMTCVFLSNLLYTLRQQIPIPHGISSIILQGLPAVLILISIPIIIIRLNKIVVISVLCSCVVIALHFVFLRKVVPAFSNTLGTYITICLPLFIISQIISDEKEMYECLVKASYIIATINIVLLFFVFSGRISGYLNDTYSMGLGYAMLLPIMILIYETIEKHKVISAVCSFFIFVSVVSFGSRGPLICISIFMMGFISCYLNQKKKKIILYLLIAILIICILQFKSLLSWIETIIQSFGIKSRTLNLLQEETIYLSHRDDAIYSKLIDAIIENPFEIRGINADQIYTGYYAHNFILELLFEFGIPFGSIICIYIGCKTVESIKGIGKGMHGKLVFAFMCISIPEMLVSTTLWTNYGFWIWLSLSIKSIEYDNMTYDRQKSKYIL